MTYTRMHQTQQLADLFCVPGTSEWKPEGRGAVETGVLQRGEGGEGEDREGEGGEGMGGEGEDVQQVALLAIGMHRAALRQDWESVEALMIEMLVLQVCLCRV